MSCDFLGAGARLPRPQQRGVGKCCPSGARPSRLAIAQEIRKYGPWKPRRRPPKPLPALTRAGIAHFAQSLGEPSLIALSTIARRRRAYYDGLAAAGRSLDVTKWLRRTGDRRHTRYWLDLPGFEKWWSASWNRHPPASVWHDTESTTSGCGGCDGHDQRAAAG